jgi:biotin-(acetyl-CoA carboxylase) ligase
VWKEKKLAGLLCEGRCGAVAVGIGLNVSQESFPEDLPEAGSLFLATGCKSDPLELLQSFCGRLTDLLSRAASGDTGPLLAAVKERSATLHRRVEVQTLLRRHVGTVVDLDAEGRIVLRTDPGRLVVLNAGQVRRLV